MSFYVQRSRDSNTKLSTSTIDASSHEHMKLSFNALPNVMTAHEGELEGSYVFKKCNVQSDKRHRGKLCISRSTCLEKKTINIEYKIVFGGSLKTFARKLIEAYISCWYLL